VCDGTRSLDLPHAIELLVLRNYWNSMDKRWIPLSTKLLFS
jgi:hypothetical protein